MPHLHVATRPHETDLQQKNKSNVYYVYISLAVRRMEVVTQVNFTLVPLKKKW